jgi:hypothetical protein
MPPKKTYPPRNQRYVLYLSHAEKRRLKEIMEKFDQPYAAQAWRLILDKMHAQLFPAVSDKAE